MKLLQRLHSRTEWLAVVTAWLVLLVLVPGLSLLPKDSPFHLADNLIPLLGKFSCLAVAALAVDLVWGYAGVLSLGHGVFFAIGGYAMGMTLMMEIGQRSVYRSKLPDFMVFLDWKELPWFWRGFDDFWYALAMAVLAPGLLALAFGFFAFRSRIRGVYLSIITQALSFALMLLFFRNETGFGGNNGLTDFKSIYGYPLQSGSTKLTLYVLTVLFLGLAYLACRTLVTGRVGRVLRATRDAEGKSRFTGYDVLSYKLFAWTVSAMLCGAAGALYVPQVGIINPSEMHPAASIEMVIWVAVGGRGTLFGAVLGAFAVNGAKSWFTASAPDYWLYFLGAAFVAVTLFLPDGIVSASRQLLAFGRRVRNG